MISRHMCAYRFARDYVIEKNILDLGCGEGYGTDYLSRVSKTALGIDYDHSIIEYAKLKYQRDNLNFLNIEASNLSSIRKKFEVICAFQFIEHIEKVDNLIETVKDLLEDQGIFICSTCNRNDSSPGSSTPFNKFHRREYLSEEFKVLLTAHFQIVDFFGLKRSWRQLFYRRLKKIGLFNFLPSPVNPVTRFYARMDCDNFEVVPRDLENAVDFIAVCKK